MSTARVYTAHTRTKSGNGWLPSEAMQGAFHLRRFASFLRRKSSENSQPATDADERRFCFMSIRLMSMIWDESPCKGTELLMLLAIADYASDEGRAWPAVRTLARKCRLSERQAQNLIRELQSKKLIRIENGQGPHGVNLYWIEGVKPIAPGGAIHSTGGVKPIAPDPSFNHQRTKRPNGRKPYTVLNYLP